MKKTNLNRRTLRAHSACVGTLAMMAATLLATGCMQEMPGEEPEQAGNAPKIFAELAEEPMTRASAGTEGRAAEAMEAFEMPLTRTTIDAAEADNGGTLAVLWTPGDQLGVFSTGSANVLYINDEQTVNVPNASFSSSANVSGDIQYAYYPYDEANDGKAATELTGAVPAEQTMGESLPSDYKYGKLKAVTAEGGYKFKFHNMFSLVRFKVDATGTEFAGQTLESVTLKVTRDGAAVPVTGEFTFSAVDGTYEAKTTSNELKTVWNRTLDGELSSFATVFPEIRSGDKLTFAVRTADQTMKFTVTSKVDFEPEMYYTFPLKLSTFAANASKYGYAVTARPVISSFSFNVSNNTGKLLNKKTEWSSRKPKATSVSSHTATIDGNNISLTIPYLYDYKLVPTFSVASGAVVSVDGKTVTSGSTEVDFTGGTTFTVSTADDYRDYKVTLSNTGLPVVVLKHSSSGDFSKVYKDIGALLSGNYRNKFIEFYIRGKDTDWVEDDQLTVYNADGTIDMSMTCGAKLRGNTSQDYPKKPFAIKLTEKTGILGMPKHKRWVLLANWLDHSMIRNTVALDIAHAIEAAWKNQPENSENKIGDGIPWNVHGQNVELVVFSNDGVGYHVGNYYLCEQIKIDKNRLNITKPYEDIVEAGNTNPGMADCGYLLEVDNNLDEDWQFETNNDVPFMFKDAVNNTILSAVQSKVQGIENKLYAGNFAEAYNDLDLNTVIDQWLIWELTMNREYGDPRSVYYFMDGDGMLSAGPVWDFDRGTFQNTTNAASQGNSDRVKPYDEWICWRTGDSDNYFWYKKLITDPIFQQRVQERWAVIYPYLQNVVNTIEAYREPLRASFGVDSAMWPTTKSDIQAHKSRFSDWSGDENINDWDDLIDNFKTVYEARLAGMNGLITSGRFTE